MTLCFSLSVVCSAILEAQSSQQQNTVKSHCHCIELVCGDTDCEMEFSLYSYRDEPHVRRPKMFEPPKVAGAEETMKPAVAPSATSI